MNTKVLQTYPTYPILLVGRAIFLAVCVFLIVTIDLSWLDKLLFGGPVAVIIGIVAVFRYSRGLTAVSKKKGINDIEWRMVYATIFMGIATSTGLWLAPDIGFSSNVFRIALFFFSVGFVLGATTGEQIFLSKTEAT
ncbi:MAG TPA: hypothetical protein VEH86_01255 [Candidatus Acidoferrum sp.]|nr:hypothetical protein [Candidatus Acidoferrum sp.]